MALGISYPRNTCLAVMKGLQRTLKHRSQRADGFLGMAGLNQRVAIGLTLTLTLLCGGCDGSEKVAVSLQVAISTGEESDQVSRGRLKHLATQIANEYMRLYPKVLLQLRFFFGARTSGERALPCTAGRRT
jgi:hypothetical protein